MNEVTSKNFGHLIAFLVPGFTALWGISYYSETVTRWLTEVGTATPTVGGFLYITLASAATGVTVSTVRWVILDTIHRWTGLPLPKWDFSRFQKNVAAYTVLIEIHYKYYQFHGNLLIALLFVYTSRRIHAGLINAPFGWLDLGFLSLSVVLFVGSRDTLARYYARVSQALGNGVPERRISSLGCKHRPPDSFSATNEAKGQHDHASQRLSKN